MANEGGFWVGAPLDEHGTHITLVVRSGAPESDEPYLRQVLSDEMRPLLPIFVRIGTEVVMKGKDMDVPTHDVHFVAPKDVRARLADIYDRLYQVPASEPRFPFEAHVTVKKPESKATVERILKYSAGQAVLGRIELNSWHTESNEPIFAVSNLIKL